MLGFAAGVMIAASVWSLLIPAIEMADSSGKVGWIPAVIGFLLGGAFLTGIDKLLPYLHLGIPESEAEGIKTSWHRSILLVLAITLHNFPEGLAVGVAFGAVAAGAPEATIGGAVALAIGIGLQNFPKGMAVSVPLRREGMSRKRSFIYGQASGMVEPIAGVLGAVAVVAISSILPSSPIRFCFDEPARYNRWYASLAHCTALRRYGLLVYRHYTGSVSDHPYITIPGKIPARHYHS